MRMRFFTWPNATRTRFRKEGFCVVENALTPEGLNFLVDQSNAELAQVSYLPRGWGERFPAVSPTLSEVPVFTDEFESTLKRICGRTTSQLGNLEYPQHAFSRQIEGDWGYETHIDGSSGTREDYAGRYEVLIGVLLSPVVDADDGALVFWPGSHLDVRENLRAKPRDYLRTAIHDCVPDLLAKRVPTVMAPPTPFVGAVGTAVICHRLLVHGTASRRRPGVRQMVYFRLNITSYDKDALVKETAFAQL